MAAETVNKDPFVRVEADTEEVSEQTVQQHGSSSSEESPLRPQKNGEQPITPEDTKKATADDEASAESPPLEAKAGQEVSALDLKKNANELPAKASSKVQIYDAHSKGFLLEFVVDKALHVLAVVEPPIITALATPYARTHLGFQLSVKAALGALMIPLLLLGSWAWIKSRMTARAAAADIILKRAVTGLQEFSKLAKQALLADIDGDTAALESDMQRLDVEKNIIGQDHKQFIKTFLSG